MFSDFVCGISCTKLAIAVLHAIVYKIGGITLGIGNINRFCLLTFTNNQFHLVFTNKNNCEKQ